MVPRSSIKSPKLVLGNFPQGTASNWIPKIDRHTKRQVNNPQCVLRFRPAREQFYWTGSQSGQDTLFLSQYNKENGGRGGELYIGKGCSCETQESCFMKNDLRWHMPGSELKENSRNSSLLAKVWAIGHHQVIRVKPLGYSKLKSDSKPKLATCCFKHHFLNWKIKRWAQHSGTPQQHQHHSLNRKTRVRGQSELHSSFPTNLRLSEKQSISKQKP